MTYAEASASLDYALRAMLALAEAHPERIKGLDLAYRYGLPHKFLGNLLAGARRAGLVQGRSGANGGYRLTRPASAMTLAEVIRAIDGPLIAVRGEPIDRVTYTGPAQHLGDVWAAVETALCSLLESVTLADVLVGTISQPLVDHVAVQPLRTPPGMDTAAENVWRDARRSVGSIGRTQRSLRATPGTIQGIRDTFGCGTADAEPVADGAA